MSRQVLQMKYHPAKKEVSFIRFVAGRPVTVRSDSKLKKYMNEKGTFVLQDHGNSFFEDIADAFDGEKSVHIDVVTTKNDYEDFAQMIEYYNNSSDGIEITASLLSELPDMEHTYQVVCDHGKKSVGILQRYKTHFFDSPCENESVKKCVEMFSLAVQKEIDSIKNKIESMTDNSINLCFAGVYSAGKSALINAIIGYKILPEDIRSETARMFRIQSPKPGEDVRIIFSIRHSFTELIWNAKSLTFEFGAAPTENDTRKIIQDTLNSHDAEKQHRQIYEVLKTLNSSEEVNADITLFFPIPLDSERVQFTIYDTPGTDSNYGEHQQVLREALSEQTHSILVFVAAPDKIEGEGNNALLSYLKEAEKKDSKTTIDIGRSLFVINKADTIDIDARKALQGAKITDKSDEDFSIKLSDKKLFFVSAMYAYSAKAVENNIETADERYRVEDDYNKIFRPERGRYYHQNRVATSEYATDIQIKRCNDILSQKEQKQDRPGVFAVCSGLFALESEIRAYGEKYAAAVRAFAIIDSVDKALSALNMTAKSLASQNQEHINKINAEIEELYGTIVDSIKMAYERYECPQGASLPDDVLKTLQIDGAYLRSSVTAPTITFFEKLLKGRFFRFGKVKYSETHKKEVAQKLTAVLSDFSNAFSQNRKRVLEQKRDAFIEDVKKAIRDNGNISDEAKNFVQDIRPPQIENRASLKEFDDIYDSRKREDKFLWIDTTHLDKEGFIDDAKDRLTDIIEDLRKKFEKDFRLTLTSTLCAVEAEFTQNTDKYSVLMRAKLDDKKAMELLRVKITEAAGDLLACQDELDKTIWSVKENV